MWLWLLISVAQSIPFETTWHTTAPGEVVTLPFHAITDPIDVSWGDGNNTNHVALPINHTYDTPGTYTISISSDVRSWAFQGTCDQLRTIENWGTFIVDASSSEAFSGCHSLTLEATDVPSFEQGATLQGFFRQCTSLNSILNWDTLNVTSMKEMFFGASSFNSPLLFVTSGVTDMSSMFQHASRFASSVNFNTANVIDMTAMFANSSFNSALNFNTAKVTSMTNMFLNTPFTQSVANWNTIKVGTCGGFCARCGLPAFATCAPCGSNPRLNSSMGWSVCNCPSDEVLLSGTQCGHTDAPTSSPTTVSPTTLTPTTLSPTSSSPTTSSPTTKSPATLSPTKPTTLAPSKRPTNNCPMSFREFFLLCNNGDFFATSPNCAPGCVGASVDLDKDIDSLDDARVTICFNELNARNHFDNVTTPYIVSKLGKGICKAAVSGVASVGGSFVTLLLLFVVF